MSQAKTNYTALLTLITVFFFWGFFAAGNSVFIPFCKNYFHLDQFQSQLIDFAFYFAYYVGALILYSVTVRTGQDPVTKWGYRKSIVYGLLFSAIGAMVMIISLYADQFAGMLLGLFVVALGFSLQQTSANPFLILLGEEATGSNRVSLGGGVNSLGGTIGPLIVALALFGTVTYNDEDVHRLSMGKVIVLYSCVGILFILIAALFNFSKQLPDGIINETEPDGANSRPKTNKSLRALFIMTGLLIICYTPVMMSYKSAEAIRVEVLENMVAKWEISPLLVKADIVTLKVELKQLKGVLDHKRMIWLSLSLLVVVGTLISSLFSSRKDRQSWGAMQYPQLVLGMLAIFLYVGVEVAVGSNLGELLAQPEFGKLGSSEIAAYVALYWGSLMMGRWASAVHVFNLSSKWKNLLVFVMPFVAFGLILGLSSWAGHKVSHFYGYGVSVLVLILGFYLGKNKPALTLAIFGTLGFLCIVIGLIPSGWLDFAYHFLGMKNNGILSVYALLSSGLFCSIMWPCIFSLSLAGLGKYQSQGSSFLIMMILGGAIIPPLQGKLSDITGIQFSFVVGAFCFAYLTIFALWVKKILRSQQVYME